MAENKINTYTHIKIAFTRPCIYKKKLLNMGISRKITANPVNKQLTETEAKIVEASKVKRQEFKVAIKTYGEENR